MSLLQVEKAEAARTFRDLGEFITEIREACSVLMTEADYYEVTLAYLRRAAAQNVRYAELQVAPQEHTIRGVPIATLLSGMHRAMAECAVGADGAAGPISSRLIIDLVKDAPVDDSVACLRGVLRHRGLAGACSAAACSSVLDWEAGMAETARCPSRAFATADIAAVGLAAAEVGFPHAMFTPVMDLARSEGLKIVSHAGM
jgi:adenosine deaminase